MDGPWGRMLRFSKPIVVRQVSNATYESSVRLLQAFPELTVVHNNIQSGIGLVGSDGVCGFYEKSYTWNFFCTRTHTHLHGAGRTYRRHFFRAR